MLGYKFAGSGDVIRNHELSRDFSIRETSREKTRRKNFGYSYHGNDNKLQEIIEHKEKVAYIEKHIDIWMLENGRGVKIGVSEDELTILIREMPHLVYSKKEKLFVNPVLIRSIYGTDDKTFCNCIIDDVERKIEMSCDNYHEFHQTLCNSPFAKIDTDTFFENKKGLHTTYLKRNVFKAKVKSLKKNIKYAYVSMLASLTLYTIPFIPFVGKSEYSLTIIPINTLLIFMLMYKRRQHIKQLNNVK